MKLDTPTAELPLAVVAKMCIRDRAGTARAVLFDRLQTGFQHLRAGGQPQVVVGAEHDAALALHDDLRALPRFQRCLLYTSSINKTVKFLKDNAGKE